MEKGTRYRRQPDPDLSRMEIMKGAARCFQERGYAATSIDTVAARIGSTKGRIYHHYSSKADLFFDVYRTGMEMNFAAIDPFLTSGLASADKLNAMIKAHVLSMIRTQPFQRVVWEGVSMFRQNALPDAEHRQLGELAELRHSYAEKFAEIMDAAKAEGTLSFDHLRVALNTLFMAANGPVFWYSPRDGQTDKDIEDIAEECARYAMRALDYQPGGRPG